MRILVDGLNFELQCGTGIKTYSRSVITALSNQGHTVDLLSQQSFKRIEHVSPLAGCLAEKTSIKQAQRIGIGERIFSYFRQIGSRYTGDIDLTKDADKELTAKLLGEEWLQIDRVRVLPGLFLRSFVRAGLGLGITRVTKLRDSELLFLTSPIPICLPGRTNVLTVHDVIPLSHPWLIDDWSTVAKTIGKALKYAIRKADKIICVSETTRQELLNRFKVDERKLHVVYQPCRFSLTEHTNTKEDEEMLLKRLKLLRTPYILFVGAIEPKKNLLNVLKAMQLDKSLPQLIVVGPFGWLCDRERAMIFELNKRVRHLGFLPDRELNILQKNAAAFVFPSIVEGFGLPALESMWNGAPCVLSDIPVFRELFLSHAHFVDPYSPAAIAGGIIKAMNRSESERMSAANHVRERFSFSVFKEELKNVIES